jgi:hypothetical protein
MNEQPSLPQQPAEESSKGNPEKNWQAVTGLVLGIVSFLTWLIAPIGILTGLIGLIFGALGIGSAKRGMAVTGVVLSIIGVLLGCLVVFGVMQFGRKISDPEFMDEFVEGFLEEAGIPIEELPDMQ